MGVTCSLLPLAQPGNSVLHHTASKQVLQLPKGEGKQHPRWLSASPKVFPKSATYWSSKARVALKITAGRKNTCRDLGGAMPVCLNFCVVSGRSQAGAGSAGVNAGFWQQWFLPSAVPDHYPIFPSLTAVDSSKVEHDKNETSRGSNNTYRDLCWGFSLLDKADELLKQSTSPLPPPTVKPTPQLLSLPPPQQYCPSAFQLYSTNPYIHYSDLTYSLGRFFSEVVEEEGSGQGAFHHLLTWHFCTITRTL